MAARTVCHGAIDGGVAARARTASSVVVVDQLLQSRLALGCRLADTPSGYD